MNPNRLYRARKNGRFFGVCAGIAEYFDFNVAMVRLFTVIACVVFPGTGILTYLILAFVLDKKPKDLYRDEKHDQFWRDVRVSPQKTLHDIKYRFMDIEKRVQKMESYITSAAYRFNQELGE
ncbi:MAG: envelope stress response membrane protein PspC [Legionellales bacterium]|nr:envelope stress response membrane protein PspC [Legionellales bacterium]